MHIITTTTTRNKVDPASIVRDHRRWITPSKPPHPTEAHTTNAQHVVSRYDTQPLRHEPEVVVCVYVADASIDDGTSEGEQLYVDSDPDSDDEDEGADPESEGKGTSETGGPSDHRSTPGDVAARHLCTSASSASSERFFSKTGLTMTKKRMRLAGDSIARILSVRGVIVSGLVDS